MGAIILNSGVLSTIQDSGRYGYQHKGVSPSGAMDKRSLKVANLLVNNEEGCPCIEVAYIGVKILFDESMNIAITGADYPVSINNEVIAMNQTIRIIAGDILEIGAAKKGIYGYISFSKKLIASKVLGSYSTDITAQIGGLNGCKLEKGDALLFNQENSEMIDVRYTQEDIETPIEEESVIRFVEGCEYNCYNTKAQADFEASCFTVSEMSDRMGYRLINNPIYSMDGNDILSDGLTIGTVQGTASGDFIVMLADRQPTGGYTRIAHIISADIPRFVQLKPGSQFRFEKITLEEAHSLLKIDDEKFQRWKQSLASSKQTVIIERKQLSIVVNGKQFNVEIEEVDQNDD